MPIKRAYCIKNPRNAVHEAEWQVLAFSASMRDSTSEGSMDSSGGYLLVIFRNPLSEHSRAFANSSVLPLPTFTCMDYV